MTNSYYSLSLSLSFSFNFSGLYKFIDHPVRAIMIPLKPFTLWKPSFVELGKIISIPIEIPDSIANEKQPGIQYRGRWVHIQLPHWFICNCQYQILLNYIHIAAFVHPSCILLSIIMINLKYNKTILLSIVNNSGYSKKRRITYWSI